MSTFERPTNYSRLTKDTAAVYHHAVFDMVYDASCEPEPIGVDLFYSPQEDPYAVQALFDTDGEEPVRWLFDREILVHGIYEPTGNGDVRAWPCLNADGAASVILELISSTADHTHVMFEARTRDISAFVHAVLDHVPLGEESKYVDLDTEIFEHILSDTQ